MVEDGKRMAGLIERGLKQERYVVDVAHTGENGLFLAEVNPWDLIVLDVKLPDADGIAVCRELRAKKIDGSILILSARDAVKDQIQGLDSRADDYLTKPFSFEEFLARVRAPLRKKRPDRSTLLKTEDLELDQLSHKVFRAGKEIMPTGREYAFLEFLLLHVNEVVTRSMITEHVGNENCDSFTNVFDVYVYRLRSKVDRDFKKPLIRSIRGVGYRIKD